MAEMKDLGASSPIALRAPSRHWLVRWLFVGLGSLLVGVGILGIFLPLLPSTIFFLMAAGCYGKSSPAAYRGHHQRGLANLRDTAKTRRNRRAKAIHRLAGRIVSLVFSSITAGLLTFWHRRCSPVLFALRTIRADPLHFFRYLSERLDNPSGRSNVTGETRDKSPAPEEGADPGKSLLDGGTHMRSKLHAVYGVLIVQRSGLQ